MADVKDVKILEPDGTWESAPRAGGAGCRDNEGRLRQVRAAAEGR